MFCANRRGEITYLLLSELSKSMFPANVGVRTESSPGVTKIVFHIHGGLWHREIKENISLQSDLVRRINSLPSLINQKRKYKTSLSLSVFSY